MELVLIERERTDTFWYELVDPPASVPWPYHEMTVAPTGLIAVYLDGKLARVRICGTRLSIKGNRMNDTAQFDIRPSNQADQRLYDWVWALVPPDLLRS